MTDSIPQQWADQAQYDFETGRAMLETGRYLYVLFCCQQAVEKVLKAVIAKRTGEMPPRVHNLVRLAEHAGVNANAAQSELMHELSRYYVETRYPDQIAEIAPDLSRDMAEEILGRTERLMQWLSSIL
jgi:HEPN domain-containing protein